MTAAAWCQSTAQAYPAPAFHDAGLRGGPRPAQHNSPMTAAWGGVSPPAPAPSRWRASRMPRPAGMLVLAVMLALSRMAAAQPCEWLAQLMHEHHLCTAAVC